MKRILIVGGWGTTHIRRFLGVLCRSKSEDLIIDAFDPSLNDTSSIELPVDNVYRIKKNRFQNRLYSIRKVGTFFYEKRKLREFRRIIRAGHFDLVNFHFVPRNAYDYVIICHEYDTKVMLTPLGSDVLRVSHFYVPNLIKAFAECDYVSANTLTGFTQKLKDRYHINEEKIVNLGYGSETITSMIDMKGKYSRQQLADMLHIPFSMFYIACGYTASIAQHHDLIIDAIYKNKDLLPQDYCILIPLTYGPDKEKLIKELPEKCDKYGLKYQLFTDYLDNNQVAALRLITNLFIHIQPTDCYNSSLQEFLLAGTECINGKWLDYPSLERCGNPYYISDTLEDLPGTLSEVLQNKAKKVPLNELIIEEITNNAWDSKITGWISFYKAI